MVSFWGFLSYFLIGPCFVYDPHPIRNDCYASGWSLVVCRTFRLALHPTPHLTHTSHTLHMLFTLGPSHTVWLRKHCSYHVPIGMRDILGASSEASTAPARQPPSMAGRDDNTTGDSTLRTHRSMTLYIFCSLGFCMYGFFLGVSLLFPHWPMLCV